MTIDTIEMKKIEFQVLNQRKHSCACGGLLESSDTKHSWVSCSSEGMGKAVTRGIIKLGELNKEREEMKKIGLTLMLFSITLFLLSFLINNLILSGVSSVLMIIGVILEILYGENNTDGLGIF